MLNLRFKPIEELYDSINDPHMIHNLVDDPRYEQVVEVMRERLREWMLDSRDLALLEETEILQRATAHASHWELGQSLPNYQQILQTANLTVQGEAAIERLLHRTQNPDSTVRFWAVLGLVALRADHVQVISVLNAAAKDPSMSVRTTAAEGLFNLGRYEEGLPAIISALTHPLPSARIRAACILDTQPASANETLRGALPYLRQAATDLDVEAIPGIPYGLNQPFQRAIKALSGEQSYYRW